MVQQIFFSAQWPLFGAAGPGLQGWLLTYGSSTLQPTILTPDLNPIRNWNRLGNGAYQHSNFPKCLPSAWVVLSPPFQAADSFWPSTLFSPRHWELYTPRVIIISIQIDCQLADSPWNSQFKTGAIFRFQLIKFSLLFLFVLVPFTTFQKRNTLPPCY